MDANSSSVTHFRHVPPSRLLSITPTKLLQLEVSGKPDRDLHVWTDEWATETQTSNSQRMTRHTRMHHDNADTVKVKAVSLQVTWVINLAVGCHYFLPGLQLPPQPLRFCCLVNRGTMGVNNLPKTVTRQRRDCDLNPGPSAPESSTLTTRLPSHQLIL